MKNKKLPLLIGFIILLIALYNLYFANIIKIFSIINPFCVFICVKFFRGIYDVKIDENTAIHFEKYMKRYPQLYQYLADIVKKNITDNIKDSINKDENEKVTLKISYSYDIEKDVLYITWNRRVDSKPLI